VDGDLRQRLQDKRGGIKRVDSGDGKGLGDRRLARGRRSKQDNDSDRVERPHTGAIGVGGHEPVDIALGRDDQSLRLFNPPLVEDLR
jgi:hypothetical protein